MAEKSFWPTQPKARVFLTDLLQGRRITEVDAIMDYNIRAMSARIADLRRLGWPIRFMMVPHPKLSGEQFSAFFIDGHFRSWWLANSDKGVAPTAYPGNEGRGTPSRRRETV